MRVPPRWFARAIHPPQESWDRLKVEHHEDESKAVHQQADSWQAQNRKFEHIEQVFKGKEEGLWAARAMLTCLHGAVVTLHEISRVESHDRLLLGGATRRFTCVTCYHTKDSAHNGESKNSAIVKEARYADLVPLKDHLLLRDLRLFLIVQHVIKIQTSIHLLTMSFE